VAGLRELGSGGGCRRLQVLVEVTAVDQPMDQLGMQNHGELSGEGDQRFFAADAGGERFEPGLQGRCPSTAKRQGLRRLEEERALKAIAGTRDLAGVVGLARLVASLRGLLTASPPEIG
jgi:hypothetical protein